MTHLIQAYFSAIGPLSLTFLVDTMHLCFRELFTYGSDCSFIIYPFNPLPMRACDRYAKLYNRVDERGQGMQSNKLY